jgi:hypothetical protein
MCTITLITYSSIKHAYTITLITYSSIKHAYSSRNLYQQGCSFVDSDVNIFEILSQSNGSNLCAV